VDDEQAEAVIRAHVEPAASIELVHERPWGSVRRVATRDGTLWFKACAPVQAFEPGLTAALAGRWPQSLPAVVAHEEGRWLLLRDAGAPIGFDGNPDAWLAILPRYAEIQCGETERAAAHVRSGVPDRPLSAFPALYESMLARPLPLEDTARARLRAFVREFAVLCDALSSAGPAETIQHDDLHGGNVYADHLAYRILDWGDACVSHPFLTWFVTFIHLDESRATVERLRDAYLEAWGGGGAAVRDAFAIAERLGPFAHLFKELRVFDALPQRARGTFAPDFRLLLSYCVEAAS
jgi:hypothetical protein